jgi:uncharacterized membrane-anchored protein
VAMQRLTDLAAAAASITAIFTAFGILVAGVTYLLKIPERIRRYFFYKSRYIIFPTPDEIARYCVPTYDAKVPTLSDVREEATLVYIAYRRERTKVYRTRIMTVYGVSLFIFSALIGKLSMITAWARYDMTPTPAIMMTGIISFAVIITTLTFCCSMLFARGPSKRAVARSFWSWFWT